MIENEHRRSWGVTQEQRRADVLAELARLKDAGTRMTVIQCGHAVYSQARKAFGSWEAALAELDDTVRKTHTPNAHAMMKELDAVSPYPCEGLPAYMRERQIVGGRMLELLASRLSYSDETIEDAVPVDFAAAFHAAMEEWAAYRKHEEDHRHA